MATSGFRPYKEDKNVKGPMEYVEETGECICGWCGQLLVPNHTKQIPEAHFKSCQNSKDNRLLKVFKDQRRVQQSLKVLNEKIDTLKTEVMDEVKANHIQMKTEMNNDILIFKAEIKTELEAIKKSGVNNDGALFAFNNKVKVLEDGMKEKMRKMGVDQDMKMAEVNGRFTGVTEKISTVVHSMLEGVKSKEATSSAGTKKLDQLKKETETLLAQVNSNNVDLKVIKRQVENGDETSSAKKIRFHVEPSPSEQQLPIPMNCINLVTSSHLFQPSFGWIIDGIRNKLKQKTLELSSNMFQWDGHHVQARAKLQLKPDDCVYVSLSLEDNYQHRDVTLFPQVYYLLKGGVKNSANAKHKIKCVSYMTGSPFKSTLDFESCIIHKNWLNHSYYNVDDSVQLKIYVEPPSMSTRHIFSYDGTLEWKVDQYKRRLQLEKETLISYQESVYFYTATEGYRVQVRLHLNGIRGAGLGARVMFLTGKYDADLPAAYPHSTTVTLVNSKEPEKSIIKNVVEDIQNNKYYDVEICTLEQMENLVEDDALLCNVKIQPR